MTVGIVIHQGVFRGPERNSCASSAFVIYYFHLFHLPKKFYWKLTVGSGTKREHKLWWHRLLRSNWFLFQSTGGLYSNPLISLKQMISCLIPGMVYRNLDNKIRKLIKYIQWIKVNLLQIAVRNTVRLTEYWNSNS